MKITVETNVAAPVETVLKAYTAPEDIKQWNAASEDWHTTSASVDLREGGTFSSRMEAKDGSMGFDFAGTYTKIIEHKLIEYSFGDRSAQVVFTTHPTGAGVQVTFDIDRGAAEVVRHVRPIGHQAAVVGILPLGVDRRQMRRVDQRHDIPAKII